MRQEEKKPEKPDWAESADYRFVNEHGEEWYAKIEEDGIVVLVGSDVDWEEKRVNPNLTYPPWILNKAEWTWLESVCKVAREKMKKRGGEIVNG